MRDYSLEWEYNDAGVWSLYTTDFDLGERAYACRMWLDEDGDWLVAFNSNLRIMAYEIEAIHKKLQELA